MMPGDDPRLRASDADRERTVELLREHHAVGRISAEEYEERMNQAFAAKTKGELDALLTDLPAIDLYQLPSAGIERRSTGNLQRRILTGPGVVAVSMVGFGIGLALGMALNSVIPFFIVIAVTVVCIVIARRRPR